MGKAELARQAASKRTSAKKGKDDVQKKVIMGVGGVLTILAVLLAMGGNGKGKKLQIDAYVNDDSLIAHSNSASDENFTAAHAKFFDKWTIADVEYGLGGVGLSKMIGLAGAVKACPSDDSVDSGNIPPSYDARTDNANCFAEARDSGNCSSSYATAAADAIAARFCIQDNTKYGGLRLSPQQVLSCDKKSSGCQGGNIDSVWSYIERRGLYPEECLPYTGKGKDQTACKTECKDDRKLKILNHCVIQNDKKHIKRDIYDHGPVVMPIFLKQEYLTYSSGVYHPTEGSEFVFNPAGEQIMHAVMVVGWGKSQGHPYWLVKHSWGPEWGENGYARISTSAHILHDHYVLTGTPATEENIKAAELKAAEAQKRLAEAKKEREERNKRIAEANEKAKAEEAAQKDAADLAGMDDPDFDEPVDAAK